MGGGTDLDEAFQFLCDRAGGGDFLVLRATGDDEYNPYIRGLCHLNSVATLIIPSREAAADPFVADAIKHASAIFIAGGDQANYINFWMNTPVQSALNDAIRARRADWRNQCGPGRAGRIRLHCAGRQARRPESRWQDSPG